MSRPRQQEAILKRLGVRVIDRRLNKHIHLVCEGPEGERFSVSVPHSPINNGRVLDNFRTYVEKKMREAKSR